VNILVKHYPGNYFPWYAVMLGTDDNIIDGTSAVSKTREQAVDECVERYHALYTKVPDERIPYPPGPQSLKAV
jgi:hypothetical protein